MHHRAIGAFAVYLHRTPGAQSPGERAAFRALVDRYTPEFVCGCLVLADQVEQEDGRFEDDLHRLRAICRRMAMSGVDPERYARQLYSDDRWVEFEDLPGDDEDDDEHL